MTMNDIYQELGRSLRIFVLPDTSLSLKVVLDNAKNYVVCGALLAFTYWLLRQDSLVYFEMWILDKKSAKLVTVICALILALSFSALNGFQTYLIVKRTTFYLLSVLVHITQESLITQSRTKKATIWIFIYTFSFAYGIFSILLVIAALHLAGLSILYIFSTKSAP